MDRRDALMKMFSAKGVKVSTNRGKACCDKLKDELKS